jgi:hypothetical protein
VAKPEPVFLVVNFYTPMMPFDRHDIEDAIEGALAQEGLGEVTGGGGFIGTVESGPQCNIDLEVSDVAQAVAVIRQVLQQLKVDSRTEIVQFEPQEIHYPVYGT